MEAGGGVKHTESGEVTATGKVGGGSRPGKKGRGSHGKARHLLHLVRPWSLRTAEGPLGLLARSPWQRGRAEARWL